LLDGVETSDGGDEFLPGDLAVSVEVYEVYPFADLECCLVRQKFLESLLEFELADSRFAVGFCFLEDDDGVDFLVVEDDAEFLHSFLEFLVLDLCLIFLFDVLHGFEIDFVSDFSLESGIPHFEKDHAFVGVEFMFFESVEHILGRTGIDCQSHEFGYFLPFLLQAGGQLLSALFLIPSRFFIIASTVSIEKLVILILGEIIVEIGIDGIEHLVDLGLIQIGLEMHNCLHELFFADFSFIGIISHPKNISKGHTFFLCTFIELIDCIDHVINRYFVIFFTYLANYFFFMLFVISISKGLVYLLFFL
jgi:hypothetical protein